MTTVVAIDYGSLANLQAAVGNRLNFDELFAGQEPSQVRPNNTFQVVAPDRSWAGNVTLDANGNISSVA